MPIRAGDLIASTPGTAANLISDGQRLRVKWSEGDGDGNSSLYLIERSIGTKRGHPTWKVYCGDVEMDKEHVPKYVYLDDCAAHILRKSGIWSKQDMKKFWPFDFDAMGRIMGRRTSRGRPAIGVNGGYETGVLRDKSKVFVFKGGPEYVSSSPPTEEGVKSEDGNEMAGAGEQAAQGDVVAEKLSNPIRTPEMAQDPNGVGVLMDPFPPLYPPNPYGPTLTPMVGSSTTPETFRFDITAAITMSRTAASTGEAVEIVPAKRKAGADEVVVAENSKKTKM